MSKTSTNTTKVVPPYDVGFKLQAISPSVIKKDDIAGGPSDVVTSTLCGSRNGILLDSDSESLANGWTRVKHPHSGVYYVHKEKCLSTLSNVLDSRIHSQLMQGADELRESPALQALKGQEVDLVLDAHSCAAMTTYYCVCHVARCIFWLEDLGHKELDIRCPSDMCSKSQSPRVHCVKAQYWKHCELFPTTLTVTRDTIMNLKDILLQAAADRLSTEFSTSPYGKSDLEQMLNVVKEMEEGVIQADARKGRGYSAWIIARFMALYNDGILQSKYGQSDYEQLSTPPNWLRIFPTILRPILQAIVPEAIIKAVPWILHRMFSIWTPNAYVKELRFIQHSFTPERWSCFVRKVDQSIRDSNLLATVLLSTNVGFLAWSDTDKTGPVSDPSVEQIMTYISMICSVGSIVSGLIVFKTCCDKDVDTPLRAYVISKYALNKTVSLEWLAITCSLPYVLVSFGFLALTTAFSVVFYRHTGIQVRIPITATLFIVLLGLFFCLSFYQYCAGALETEDKKAQERLRKEEDASCSEA